MLSKKTFVEAMNAIVKHREIMDELKIPLRKLGEFPFSLDIESMHREALLKVLREVTGDDSDWITCPVCPRYHTYGFFPSHAKE